MAYMRDFVSAPHTREHVARSAQLFRIWRSRGTGLLQLRHVGKGASESVLEGTAPWSNDLSR